MWRLAKLGRGRQLVLVLSGHVAAEQLEELRRTVEVEARQHEVALNLENLRIVDQDVVTYLVQCEKNGIRIENCPRYIQEWISKSKPGAEV